MSSLLSGGVSIVASKVMVLPFSISPVPYATAKRFSREGSRCVTVLDYVVTCVSVSPDTELSVKFNVTVAAEAVFAEDIL